MKTKSTIKILMLMLLVSISIPNVSGQIIFQEDFDGIPGPTGGGAGTYVFPAGWSLFNVDGLTPHALVTYVNDAWERREDFANDVNDSCAFSTSYYSSAGQADDWMFTPAINLTNNNVLSWNAVTYDPSYPDGYEVRIMSVAPNSGNLLTSTVIETVGAENDTWTNRSVNLQSLGYANETVYIGFRNNSYDMFLLLIDDVTVEEQMQYDASLVSTDMPAEYTMIPVSQSPQIVLGGTISNEGIDDITDVAMIVNVYNSGMLNVYSDTSATVPVIIPGNDNYFTLPDYSPITVDDYLIQYVSLINEADGNTYNDTAYQFIMITDSTYARDNGYVTGALGIGAGNGGFLGNQFEIVNQIEVNSITMWVNGGYTGEPMALVVFDMLGGTPNQIICSTDTLYYPHDTAAAYTLNIYGGPYTLVPGDYVFTALEFDSVLQVSTTAELFTAGAGWVDWPTNPFGQWSYPEDFGFNDVFVIRPNFKNCLVITSNISSVDATCWDCSDGSVSVNPTGGYPPYSYYWSDSSTTAVVNSLLPGTYSVTITDSLGCSTVDNVVVSSPLRISDPENIEFEVVLSPNPNNGNFNLIFNNDINETTIIGIYNVVGEKVFYQELPAINKSEIYPVILENVSAGNYYVKIVSPAYSYINKFIVK